LYKRCKRTPGARPRRSPRNSRTRTRTAETADATYGRLPRSRADRRRAQACGARRSRADIGARQQPLWVTHTHQAGRRRWQGARRVETRWRGAARGDNRAIVASPGSARMPSPTSPCNALTLPCYRARRGGVEDAGGIKPACTDAPDGARPRGERKDALDTVALRRCRAQVASIVIAAAASSSLGVKPLDEAPHSALVAPRNALRRRLRRRTCTARARTPRHRATGTSWPELGGPSAAPL
jgi:hypothetical protein